MTRAKWLIKRDGVAVARARSWPEGFDKLCAELGSPDADNLWKLAEQMEPFSYQDADGPRLEMEKVR